MVLDKKIACKKPIEIVPLWTRSEDDGDYMFTIDTCSLPKFDEIKFMDVSIHSMDMPNAGGSSNISEALSMERMAAVYKAKKFVPEMEVCYWIESSMCDYLMTMENGENVGVSVTRAIKYPYENEITLEDARFILQKKLYKLMVARNAISEEQSFYESILHIWCYTEEAAYNFDLAHRELIEEDIEKTYNRVYVICTISDREYIYSNKK